MPRRYFNWKLAIVLIISICVLGVTAVGLRQWQRTHRADQGLILGNKAYDEQKWDEAAKYFGRYLAIEQVDVPILMKYAEAQLKIRPSKRGNIAQALEAYGIVLRADRSNSKAAMLLTKLYLEILAPSKAELIASKYLKNNDDPDPKIREMLVLAMIRNRKSTEAEAELKAIIQEHDNQISAYEMLGKLAEERPDDITDPNDPVHWFNEAVEKNPSSALAYIARADFYLYQRNKDRSKAIADLESNALIDLEEAKKLLVKLKIQDPNVELRLAVGFMNANILDKAEEHLTSVQTSIPTDLRVWEKWAELAMKFNSKEKMQEIAETGLKELSYQSLDFMPIATELFIRSGQLERADECISEMKQKDVAPMGVAFLEGLLAFKRENLSKAIDDWQESIGLGNKSPIVRLMLSSALSRVGDTQSALRHLRTLVSDNPDYITGHLELAKLWAQTRNWAESARSAATAKQISPENPEASLLYLRAQMQLREADSAGENILTFQDIEKQLSEQEETANNLSGEASSNLSKVKLLKFQLAMLQDKFTDAQALVTQLKELVTQLKKDDPLQIKTTMAEVGLLVAQDKTDEAIEIYLEALKKFPQTIELVGYLAVLLDRKGDNEKCEEIIKEALKRIDQPANQRELGLLLAKYYVQWNQNDKVYSHLNTLVQQLPEDILLKRWLLGCEQITNDSAKAQQLVDEIKELEGDDGWQWRYEQARIWFSPEDFEARYAEILSLLQYNIKENPNDQESLILLAAAYSQADELKLAISTYREALSRSPNDLRIIIPLIDVLSKSMEFDEVDQLLKRAGNSQQELYKTQLQQFQLESHWRHGQLSSASDILQDFIRSDPNDQAKRFSLALLKTQQDKYDQAKELLDELKAQSPDSMLFTYTLIQLSILQDKPNEALRLCDEMVNNLNNASAYILRARTNITLKQIDKAIEDFEHAAAVEPNNVDVWMTKSNFYYFIGQPDKAIADFDHAAAIEPNNVKVWMAKSAFNRSIGRPDKAIEDIQCALSLASDDILIQKQDITLLLESGDEEKVLQGKAKLAKALESNPDDVYLRMFHANSLLMENKATAIEKAMEILQKITEDQPEISMAWVLLGNISLSKGQAEKAMEIAFRGLSHTPNDKDLLLVKARAEAARSPVLAIPTLKALLEPNPNNTEAALLLAEIYIAVGEPEKAVNLLEAQLLSLAGTPDKRKINVVLAMALYKNGNKVDAQKIFDSLQSEPNDPVPLLTQVRLLKDDRLWDKLIQKISNWCQKHPEDSRTPVFVATKLVETNDSQAIKAAVRIVLENLSDSVGAMTRLASLLQIRGHSDEAILLYEQVRELQPENQIVINNLAWIMCNDKGVLQKALQLAQKGLKIDPNYADLLDTRGVIYYKMGEFDKAVEDFDKCIELYKRGAPAAIGSHIYLAKAFTKLGQKNNAVEHLKQALDLNQALDPERRIGILITSDIAEAKQLLKQLQEGN